MANRPPLTKEQVKEILKAMKTTKVKREYRRLQAIYLYGTGEDTKKIIKITSSGNTGNTTGSHVHFEIRRYGKPLNPLTYIH